MRTSAHAPVLRERKRWSLRDCCGGGGDTGREDGRGFGGGNDGFLTGVGRDNRMDVGGSGGTVLRIGWGLTKALCVVDGGLDMVAGSAMTVVGNARLIVLAPG